jgi:hypothetical protein
MKIGVKHASEFLDFFFILFCFAQLKCNLQIKLRNFVFANIHHKFGSFETILIAVKAPGVL